MTPGISLRDEPWPEAKEIIIRAFDNGYRWLVIDDGLMMFREHPGEGGDVPAIEARTIEEALEYADQWWQF